jgi:4-hydroxybenzoate polyprenyltransferase
MQERLALYLDLIRFNRPAGWLLLLWPTLSALWIAAGGFPGWHLMIVFTLGTILMRSAGCCINDVADADFDRHVKRTAHRPVTSGKVSKKEALLLGACLATLAFCLVLTTNLLTVLYSFAALAIAIAYPFAKRFVAMPQAVLGVAFSLGIPMAFAAVQGGDSFFAVQGGDSWFAVQGGDSFFAVRGSVPPLAWTLLLGNLFWVLAYDTEYAMVDRDDDLRIGMKTSAITLGRFDVAAVMLFYLVYMLIWLFAGLSSAANAMKLIVVALTSAQILWHWQMIRNRSREGCFRAFRLNHWLGLTFFAGIVASAIGK